MAKEREYTYYLEPRGNVAYSNEILGKNIGEEDAMERVLCSDGEWRNLWRCLHGIVFMLWQSRSSLSKLGKKFSIRIFEQEGHGQIRDVTDWYRKRHQKKERAAYGKF